MHAGGDGDAYRRGVHEAGRLFADDLAFSEDAVDAPVEHDAPGEAVEDLEEHPPEVEIRTSTRRRKTIGAHWEGGRIVVVVPHRLPMRDRQAYADELAARLIAGRARRRPTDAALTARAAELSLRYFDGQAVPSSVTWSSRQHARWGSCTPSDRTIRISDRLRGVPAWVLDTVLVHELAHLIHAEHSPEFHRLVDRHPRMAESDAFLAGYALGLERASATGG
jgi:predicted metal-dependent hydrolase